MQSKSQSNQVFLVFCSKWCLTRHGLNNCNFGKPRRFGATHPIYFAAINLICGYCHTFSNARALHTAPNRNWWGLVTPSPVQPRQIDIWRYKSKFIDAPSRPSIYRRPWVEEAATIESPKLITAELPDAIILPSSNKLPLPPTACQPQSFCISPANMTHSQHQTRMGCQ